MIEPFGQVSVERSLRGMPARTVPAIMTKGDRVCQGDVSSDSHRN